MLVFINHTFLEDSTYEVQIEFANIYVLYCCFL